MDRKIRVAAVSYLNTKPLIYGFEKGMMKDDLELQIDYPSKIAAALINDEVDLGLVPVAIIPQMKFHQIVSDYCISSNGEVSSVCLFSDVPLNHIKTIYLDYQSSTSVALVKILVKEYWKISPDFVDAGFDFREKIKDDAAGVVIGDRAFEQRKISKYIYDLGEAWKAHTSLPFIFAAWISNKPISSVFLENFNETNKFGLNHIDEVVAENPYDLFDLKSYYTKSIHYLINKESQQGLNEFIKKIGGGLS